MRRRLLRVVLASIVLNAALGVAALLVPHFGGAPARVLGTSGCVTGVGVLALACLPAWELRRLGRLPPLGMALAGTGFALVIAEIWLDIGSDAYAKSFGTMLAVSVLVTLLCLTTLVRLLPRYAWVPRFAGAAAGVLTAMFVTTLWADLGDGWYARSGGVVAVLLAASLVALPVLHRASRGRDALPATPGSEFGALAEPRFCPFCGTATAPGAATPRDLACAACGARVAVQVLEPPFATSAAPPASTAQAS